MSAVILSEVCGRTGAKDLKVRTQDARLQSCPEILPLRQAQSQDDRTLFMLKDDVAFIRTNEFFSFS